MLEKHRATLTDGHLEWDGEAPKEIKKKRSVKVDVIVVSPQPELKKPDGEKMAAAIEALRSIADRGGIKSIKDPVKWQRAIRKDRPLPGR